MGHTCLSAIAQNADAVMLMHASHVCVGALLHDKRSCVSELQSLPPVNQELRKKRCPHHHEELCKPSRPHQHGELCRERPTCQVAKSWFQDETWMRHHDSALFVCTGGRATGHQEMEGTAVLPNSHEDSAVTGANGRSCTCYVTAELSPPFFLRFCVCCHCSGSSAACMADFVPALLLFINLHSL